MSGGYNPKVSNPDMSNLVAPMMSGGFQTPFFFGGSQVPTDLALPKGSFSGSGFVRKQDTFPSSRFTKGRTHRVSLPNR
jgi:hypothetical protein